MAVLLPLTILSALVRKLSGGRTPSVVSLLDGPVFTPYELRRVRHEHVVDETHGFWKRVGDRVAVNPKRTFTGAIAVLLVMCLGLFFFSTDLTTNDGYRDKVESIEGQELLAKSFPAGSSAPTDIIVERAEDVETRLRRRRGCQRRADREPAGRDRRERPDVDPGDARAAAVLDGGVRADRADPRRGRPAPRSSAARPRSSSTCAKPPPGTRLVIPPIVLLVVFLILMLLLRAVIGPLVLIGTVILSYAAALGVSYFMFDVVFGFAGSDPSLPLFGFVFLVALGRRLQHLPRRRAHVRRRTRTAPARGCCARSRSPAASSPSAGIVLAGTFAVLGSLPLVFLTEIGFVVAFGVLLDTFLVRSVLVPAATLMIGPKFWWPSRLASTDGAAVRSR